MCIYYIYAYIRSKDSSTAKAGTPYYIGKGTRDHYKHKAHAVSVPSDSSFIIILESGLTNIGALALERRLIEWWGRKDIGTGILMNRTSGGDGSIGYKHSDETKRKISQSEKGKTVSEKSKQKMSRSKMGHKVSCAQKELMSYIHKGKVISEDQKQKISTANTGRKHGPQSEERRRQTSIRNKGSCWITHPTLLKNKRVRPEAVDRFLGEGWVLGQIRY